MADVSIEKRPGAQEHQSVARREYDPFSRHFGVAPWRGFFDPFISSPFSLMQRMQDEMERFFGTAGQGGLGREMTAWSPAMEVMEKEGKMIVRTDLPGIDKNDIKVELTDGSLTIRGERKREHEQEKQGYHRSERSYGSFFRSIQLPEGANPDQAKAQFRDGVLEVTIPIPESQKARTIPIEEGTEKKQISSEGTSSTRQSKVG
ncbi:MAG: Hsp20/alpha crystallin family protein [Bryobacterales bacterium]|nr:Hsp20/alpha crystallin family protein [Bryobacterales bacterium]MBV9399071.1 Hsp20/alpha crystallin family protein [Bryobacterales bacterium]